MAPHRTLTVTSLVTILLFSLHWADEIARGIEPGTLSPAWGGLAILGVWLSATLVFHERRGGLALVALASILAAAVPVLHMQGGGLVGGRIPANSAGALFWVWTNIALGASGLVSFALAVRVWWTPVAHPRE
jgi:multidrug transporter EmrE-like cation transporter